MNSKIGQHNILEISMLYYNNLYRKAIGMAKASDNFNATLKELVPELASNPALLQSLMKDPQ
jgi:hypothetical protein